MHIIKTTVLAALIAVGFAGCAANPFRGVDEALHGGPRINDNVFMGRNGGFADNYDDIPSVIPLACRGSEADGIWDPLHFKPNLAITDPTEAALTAAESAEDNRRKIEEHIDQLTGPDLVKCVHAMKALIDLRFARFEHVLNASLSTGNFLLDTSVLGLATSVPLVAPGTAKVLGAIAAGLVGSHKNFDQDVLYSFSIQTIVQRMRTDRAAQASLINDRLTSTTHPYADMYEASADLFEYAQAGSWDHAMASQQTSVAAQTATCEARLRDQKMGNTADAKPASSAPDSAATDPCNPPPKKEPATKDVVITFGANNALDNAQTVQLNNVASTIIAGVLGKTISGVKIQGQAAASETPDPAKAATDRAKLIQEKLIALHVDEKNITIDTTTNVNGAAAVTISYLPLAPEPAPPGNQVVPESKNPAPPPSPPPPAPTDTFTKDALLPDAIFKTATGASVVIMGVDGDDQVSYVGPDSAGIGGVHVEPVATLFQRLKTLVAPGHH